MTPAERKQRLRRQAAALPKLDEPALVEAFLALPKVEQADTVMLFYGVGRELDTTPLLEALLAQGKRVCYPVCLPERQMQARAVSGPEQLVPGKFGIPAPGEDCPLVPQREIDAVLVPCLLCDRQGYRLGYGGGYYDRFLGKYPGATVGIIYRQNLYRFLPHGRYDASVSVVVSEKGFFYPRKGESQRRTAHEKPGQ